MWVGVLVAALLFWATRSSSPESAPLPSGQREFLVSMSVADRGWSLDNAAVGQALCVGAPEFDRLFRIEGDQDRALCDLTPALREKLMALSTQRLAVGGGALRVTGRRAEWGPSVDAQIRALRAALPSAPEEPLVDALRARAAAEPDPRVRIQILRRLLLRCGDVPFVQGVANGIAGASLALRVELAVAAEDRAALLEVVGDRFEPDDRRLAALAALRLESLDGLGGVGPRLVADGGSSGLLVALVALAPAGVPDAVQEAARARVRAGAELAPLARLIAAGRRAEDHLWVAEHLHLLPVDEAAAAVASLGDDGPVAATGPLRRFAATVRDPGLRRVVDAALDALRGRGPFAAAGELSVAEPHGAELSRADGQGELSRPAVRPVVGSERQ